MDFMLVFDQVKLRTNLVKVNFLKSSSELFSLLQYKSYVLGCLDVLNVMSKLKVKY